MEHSLSEIMLKSQRDSGILFFWLANMEVKYGAAFYT